MRGRFVYLEPLQPEHREIIRQLARDPRIWEFTRTLIVDEHFDKMFDQYFDVAIDPKGLGEQQSYVVRQTNDDAVIGMTRMYEISRKDKTLMIGYTWYSPAVWGKVHNKECKLLLLQHVFEELKYNRAEFRVAHQNIRSQKAVEKIGGVKEGVLRKSRYNNDGEITDTFIYSIIDDEWPVKKEKLIQLIG